MSTIENISAAAIEDGNHRSFGDNTILIQIMDPTSKFPDPAKNFKNIFKFNFVDIEDDDPYFDDDLKEFAITDQQARYIAFVLRHALNRGLNVVVHCHAGIARSGAVAKVAIDHGFEDLGNFRQPNQLVYNKINQAWRNLDES